jgi:hypothetical protein
MGFQNYAIIILLHVWGSLGSVTLALLQQCTSTTLLRSLDMQQYWTALASLADNNGIVQHCCVSLATQQLKQRAYQQAAWLRTQQ